MNRVTRYGRELWRRREFAQRLALSNLKARNASTVLGLVWWILNPLLLAGVYFLVFGVIFGDRRPDDFLGYLLAGIFVFTFTTGSMIGSVNSVLSNAKLMVNLRFPRLILPVSSVFEALVGFLASLVAFYALVLPTGQLRDWPKLWMLPLLIVVHILFNLGVGAVVARLTVPFRDLNNLIPYFNRLWLYVTPIIWPISFLDEFEGPLRALIDLNPMKAIVGVYRSALLGYDLVPGEVWTALVWAVAIAVIGVGWFVRDEGHMVRYL